MQSHQQQLRDAITWCKDAAASIVNAKETVKTNVKAAQVEIRLIEDVAAQSGQDSTEAVRTIVGREYDENVATINALAVGLGGTPYVPAAPVEEPGKPDPCQLRVTSSA